MKASRFRFRAWDKGKHRWIHEESCNLIGETILMGEWLRGVCVTRYDDVILMQSTGLVDSKGVEIYEGDILSTKNGPVEVKWQSSGNCGFYPFLGESDCCGCSAHAYPEKVEVIGNIYQHHHLLKGE